MAFPQKPTAPTPSPVTPPPTGTTMGAGAPPAPGGGGAAMAPVAGKPMAPGNPNQGATAPVMKTKPLPTSQFQTAQKPPEIPLEPLKMPDTHVTPEYCLEQMGRVLEELAERQEDPLWVTTHIALAEAWRTAAETLLNHAVAGQQIIGDAHLKQQQIDQQHDMHTQTLSHNDQAHFQKMKQTDDQHGQKMKQNEDMHKKNLQQTDVLNSQKMKQNDEHHKVNLDLTKKKAAMTIQQQQTRAKQQAQQRKSSSGSK